MRNLQILGLALVVCLVATSCKQALGIDDVEDGVNQNTEAIQSLTPTEPQSPCEENPQGQGCVDQRNVEVGLLCAPNPAVALAVNCSATASSFASWYTWNCGVSGSEAPERGQEDKTCTYLAAGTYRIGVLACEFEAQDDHCDSAEQVIEVQ